MLNLVFSQIAVIRNAKTVPANSIFCAMNKLLLFFVFALQSLSSYSDVGPPPVQAVCRITLKNGDTLEGFISLGNNYGYYYRTDAICIIKDDSIYYTRKLNLNFRQIDFNFELSKNMHCKDNCKFYFAKSYRPESYDSITFKRDSLNNLIQTYLYKDNFKLLSEFPIFKSLPLSLYLGYEEDTSETKVPIEQIKRIEILIEPAKFWLDKIESAREKRLNDKEAWEDYVEPVWYHDIFKDSARINYFQSLYEKW